MTKKKGKFGAPFDDGVADIAPKGKTMGELGLTREQMKKAYPWGGKHSSPSK